MSDEGYERVPDTQHVRDAARELAHLLHKAGDKGVYASVVHARVPYAQQAAAWLRESGIAVVATREGGNSKWWIAPIASERYTQSAQRVVTDTYTHAVRKHQSMANTQGNRAARRMLKRTAVEAGSTLGYSLTEIDRHLKSVPLAGEFADWLVEHGYMPSSMNGS